MRRLLTIILLLCCGAANAQDTIVTWHGKNIMGRVTSTDWHYVRFKTAPNWLHSDSVDRFVKSKAIKRVAFSNGRIWERPRRVILPHHDVNVLTLNTPAYTYFDTYPGVSIGLEYDVFFTRNYRYSLNFSVHYFWAGSPSWSKLYNETRANLKGPMFMPGFFYHPLSNAGPVDLSIGLSVPVGDITRSDVTEANGHYSSYYDGSHMLLAFLLQGNISLQGEGNFVFTLYGSCGPMIPAGITSGLTGQIGFKAGARY